MCIITGPTNIANNSSFIIANISSSIALNNFQHIQMIQLQKSNIIEYQNMLRMQLLYYSLPSKLLDYNLNWYDFRLELTWSTPIHQKRWVDSKRIPTIWQGFPYHWFLLIDLGLFIDSQFSRHIDVKYIIRRFHYIYIIRF